MAPLVAVIGATGKQGGSVLRALRESKTDYHIRAITRDVSKASGLDGLVNEITSADADDLASLTKAFEGADIVFAMTISDYFAHDYVGKELRQGKAMMDAAHAAGVKTVIWAGLTSVSEASHGKITCTSLDEKAQVTAYGRSLNTFKLLDVQPAGYMSNHLYSDSFLPRKNDDGSYTLAMPIDSDAPWPLIDMDADYGKFAVLALEKGGLETVYASGGMSSPNDIAAALSKASGKQVSSYRLPDEVFAGFLGGPEAPMAKALIGMHKGIEQNGYYGNVDASESAKILGFEPVTFEQYLAGQKAKIAEIFA